MKQYVCKTLPGYIEVKPCEDDARVQIMGLNKKANNTATVESKFELPKELEGTNYADIKVGDKVAATYSGGVQIGDSYLIPIYNVIAIVNEIDTDE